MYNGFIPNYSIAPSCDCMKSREDLFFYWAKYLLQRAIAVFDVTLPKSIDYDYFMFTLLLDGGIAVFKTPKYGVIAQRCSVLGYNLYDKPTEIQVNNTVVQGIERTIDKDCVLFTINPNYTGMWDIISYYAVQLAEIQLSANINLRNVKLAYVYLAEDNKEAENFKKMTDKVDKGEAMVFAKKGSSQNKAELFFNNVANTYIVDKLLVDMRKVISNFDMEMGIPTVNTEKKERLISDEANSNNAETTLRINYIIDRLKKECRKCKEMFGVDIDISLKGDLKNADSLSQRRRESAYSE